MNVFDFPRLKAHSHFRTCTATLKGMHCRYLNVATYHTSSMGPPQAPSPSSSSSSMT